MKKKFLASAIAAIFLAHNPLAFGADQTTPSPNSLERITITGSNISRINKEGPTAIEVNRREEIEKSGASTVLELLSKLPSVSVSLDGNNPLSFALGAASVGLRGLNAKYTLTLLNGRRLASYGFADGAENSFVDLNNLPLAAIESVEILRDGASAIYGSDAVAGVINFKTKRNYQGIEGTANLGTNEKGDGGTASASIVALETALAKIQWSKVELRDPVKAYNRMELNQLHTLAPHFEWDGQLIETRNCYLGGDVIHAGTCSSRPQV